MVEVIDAVEDGEDLSGGGDEGEHVLFEVYNHVVDADLAQDCQNAYHQDIPDDLSVGEAEANRRDQGVTQN